MTSWRASCSHCKNFLPKKTNEFGDPTCKAFPDGVPLEILMGKNDHKDPYPGDNGIRFEESEQGRSSGE